MPVGRTRKRETSYQPGTFQTAGKLWLMWAGTRYFMGDQTIWTPQSRFRQWTQDETHPGPPWHSGGPFASVTTYDRTAELTNVALYRSADIWPGTYYEYEGGFAMQDMDAVNGPRGSEVATSGSSGPYSLAACDASAYGATAWKRFKPAKPTADLAVAIGEAKDIPRMLRTTAKGFHDVWKSMGGHPRSFGPKKVADHWLNTQFGWLPFISDMQKMYKAFADSDAIYRRMYRDNGQWIPRRGTVKSSVETVGSVTSSTATALYPVLPSYFYLDPTKTGDYTCESIKEERIWFSARFRYYMPWLETEGMIPSMVRFQLWNYGLKISPSLLWELTPWSWLVDYFSNVGDVMNNLSDSDSNLVAKYAYIMRSVVHRKRLITSAKLVDGTISSAGDCIIATLKGRNAANPYGFALTFDDLSARQWSILTALGFSRSRLSW